MNDYLIKHSGSLLDFCTHCKSIATDNTGYYHLGGYTCEDCMGQLRLKHSISDEDFENRIIK